MRITYIFQGERFLEYPVMPSEDFSVYKSFLSRGWTCKMFVHSTNIGYELVLSRILELVHAFIDLKDLYIYIDLIYVCMQFEQKCDITNQD